MEKWSRRQFVRIAGAGAAIAAAGGVSQLIPNVSQNTAYDASLPRAYADDLPDIMLGVFTNSQNDGTDTFYMSIDGFHFEKISQAFENLDKNNPDDYQAVGSGTEENPYPVETKSSGTQYRTWSLYSFNCPSLLYHNGLFWMLANESNGGDDATLRLVISASRDLIHWCDQRQVKVNVAFDYPSNGQSTKFDCVGADWAVNPSGEVYAVASLGYYGSFHGDAENDTMTPCLVKINKLEAIDTFDPSDNPMQNDSRYITVETSAATKISLPSSSTNRIDGSFYFEGSNAYLSIKKNGVTNEIWKIADLSNASDANAWTRINDNVVTGYEAPSLTKFNGEYYMFVDELATWTPDDHVRDPYYSTGTHMLSSSAMEDSFSAPERIDAYDKNYNRLTHGDAGGEFVDGPRHGTVITVTDPEAKAVVWAARSVEGWTDAQEVSNPPYEITTWKRLSGNTRYDTMLSIVSQSFTSSEYAVFATGDAFPDALAASSLAGALRAPIILFGLNNTYQASVALDLLRVSKAYVVGGTSAIPDYMVEDVLDAAGVQWERLAGKTRQETAVNIAKEVAKLKGSPQTAIIATGSNFPDALAISSYAYANAFPIYLTLDDGTLDDDTISAVKKQNYSNYIYVGGTHAVSDEVTKQLGVDDSVVRRLAGEDRYGSSEDIAKFCLSEGMQASGMAVTTGENYPDALAGASLAGYNNSIIMLASDARPTEVVSVLSANKNSMKSAYVLGGEGVISAGLFDTLSSTTDK